MRYRLAFMVSLFVLFIVHCLIFGYVSHSRWKSVTLLTLKESLPLFYLVDFRIQNFMSTWSSNDVIIAQCMPVCMTVYVCMYVFSIFRAFENVMFKEPLKKMWADPDLDDGQKFLRDFFLNERYRGSAERLKKLVFQYSNIRLWISTLCQLQMTYQQKFHLWS